MSFNNLKRFNVRVIIIRRNILSIRQTPDVPQLVLDPGIRNSRLCR